MDIEDRLTFIEAAIRAAPHERYCSWAYAQETLAKAHFKTLGDIAPVTRNGSFPPCDCWKSFIKDNP